jgi:hypothetical protein
MMCRVVTLRCDLVTSVAEMVNIVAGGVGRGTKLLEATCCERVQVEIVKVGNNTRLDRLYPLETQKSVSGTNLGRPETNCGLEGNSSTHAHSQVGKGGLPPPERQGRDWFYLAFQFSGLASVSELGS